MSKVRCKKAARRLACYLNSIGIRPAVEHQTNRQRHNSLLKIYSALPDEQRREARRRGRRVINAIGLKSATADLFPSKTVPLRVHKQERAYRMAVLLRQSLGRCASCTSWGRQKRSWPARELAEAFRPFAGDMSLEPYECPIAPGTYHLGHRKEALADESQSKATDYVGTSTKN
jgi:hypothetical protein